MAYLVSAPKILLLSSDACHFQPQLVERPSHRATPMFKCALGGRELDMREISNRDCLNQEAYSSGRKLH